MVISRLPLATSLFLLVCLAAAAQAVSVKSHTDWQAGTFTLFLDVPVDRRGTNPAAAELSARRMAERELRARFIEAVSGLLVDSGRTAGDLAAQNPEGSLALADLAMRGRLEPPKPSPTLDRLLLSYVYSIQDIAARLAPGPRRALSVPRELGWTATADYSGLVIYAMNPVPVHGEPEAGAELVRPAAFPELYDEDLRPLLRKSMVAPDYLQKWGVAAYSPGFDERTFVDRIGHTPLRVFCVGVFGRYRADLLLPRDAVRELTYTENNRRLLAEGKILILTPAAAGPSPP